MKKFLTIADQINLLKSRNLVINDENYVANYLLSNNYYNIINGYGKYFPQSNDVYTNGTTFNEIARLYLFDRELKQVFFKALINIEAHLKAIFAHRFAEEYSLPYAYLNTACYDSKKALSVVSTIYHLSGTINHYRTIQGTSIYHYIKKHNDVPIWVLVNYLDFGELRHMLAASTTKIQNKVAKDMESFIRENIKNPQIFTPETMLSFIENINDVRNICAHNNRLIGFQCRRDSKYWKCLHDPYGIAANDKKRDVYSVFISTQCFLSKIEFAILHNSIRKLMNMHLKNQLQSIPQNTILRELGFPDDWDITTPKINQSLL